MDLYDSVSYAISKKLTLSYSTSFGLSSKLFSRKIRSHIYAVYGLVRIADEVVDTYTGDEQLKILNNLEDEVYRAIKREYSPNPVIHSFAKTAKIFDIDKTLIAPFFSSMRIDIGNAYTTDKYIEYIYGSAEVVGLMCLKVFCGEKKEMYQSLEQGARSLGSAYQKVNFLRDFKKDHEELGRVYFPDIEYKSFKNSSKRAIEKDIKTDFENAKNSVVRLPIGSRVAVATSYSYYLELLTKIESCSAAEIKSRRVRINNFRKLVIMFVTIIKLGKV